MTPGSTALGSIFLNHHMRLDLTAATPTDSSFKGRPDLSAPSSQVAGQKPQDTGVPGPLHSHRSPMSCPLPCQDCGPSESSRTLTKHPKSTGNKNIVVTLKTTLRSHPSLWQTVGPKLGSWDHQPACRQEEGAGQQLLSTPNTKASVKRQQFSSTPKKSLLLSTRS